MSSRILDRPLRVSIFPIPRFLLIAYLPEALILAMAALTRFWRLGYHSFWFDESVSLGWAGAGVAYTWEKTFALVEEKHPPGYYLSLHYWRELLDLFGLAHNDVALRLSGSLMGVLTVLGVLLLATRLSGRRTALLAGLLVALSPALVWYSQELRMFQPATTAIVWGLYFLVRATSDDGRQTADDRTRITHHALRTTHYVLFILTITYALYSYLFAAFALPGIGLSLFVLSRQAGRFQWRIFGEGVLALGIITALFLPLARNAWLINRSESPPGQLFGDFLPYLWGQLRTFTIWQVDWPDPLLFGALALFLLLLLAAFVLPDRGHAHDPVRSLLLLWIAPPFLMGGVMQATNANVLKEERYFLFLAPFVLWTIARASILLAQRWPWLGTSSGGLSVLLLLLALPALWTPRLYREDWRGTADSIAAYQQRSEHIPAAGVIHAGYLYPALNWYLEPHYSFGELPVYQISGGSIAEAEMEIVAPRLAGIEKSGAETLWLVQSHLDGVDDQRLLQGWLDARYPLITEQFLAGVQLRGYALRTRYEKLPALPAPAFYPDAELAPGVKLAACEITTPEVSARDEAMHPAASGWIHVRLWWQATAPVEQNYRSSISMVGPEGGWGEKLERENEVLDRFPLREWTADHFVRDEADVHVNPATPGNRRYQVTVALRTEDGEVLPQRANCGEVWVR